MCIILFDLDSNSFPWSGSWFPEGEKFFSYVMGYHFALSFKFASQALFG